MDRDQRGGDLLTAGAEQFTGPAAQCAVVAPSAFIELVLQAAVEAGVANRQAGAVGAGRRGGSGWADQPTCGVAAVAGAAVAQHHGVTGLADRPLDPVRGWRLVLCAADADGGPARRAAGADRSFGARETAWTQAAAARAEGLWLGEAAVADVRLVAVGAPRDPTDPAAPAALALWAVRAARADRQLVAVATSDGFDDPATGACFGELAASAAGANPTFC